MDNFDLLLEQMAADLSTQACRLDDIRQQMFLSWLKSHSSRVKEAYQLSMEVHGREIFENCLRKGLKGLLESFSQQGLLWEYSLILDEVTWWRDVDPHTLARILKSEGRD